MKYAWEDWSLDKEAGLLTRRGRPMAVSRRVLDCIAHLIAHRDRVVGHAELIALLWKHPDASHHQLHQVVQAARRRLGDDGKSQRLIRTVGRLGYQWTGPLDEAPGAASWPSTMSGVIASSHLPANTATAPAGGTPAPPPDARVRHDSDHDLGDDPVQASSERRAASQEPPRASPAADAASSAPARPAGMPHAAARRRQAGNLRMLLLVTLLLGAVGYHRVADAPAPAQQQPPAVAPQAPPGSLDALETALYAGDFETVREGLAALPPSKAESPDAMLISMRLDLQRGQFDRARNKLDRQMALARTADDAIWQAKLLVFQAQLQGRRQAPATEQLASAQSAIDLLAPLGDRAAPGVLADALERRSAALLLLGRSEEALRDLARSSDLYAALGDARRFAGVRFHRARVWMRTGRLEDALKETRAIADQYRRLSDRIGAVNTYIAMTRIQMELLRWDDALASNDRALEIFRANPLMERRGHVLELRAVTLAHLGRLREARATLEEIQALSGDRSGSPFAIPYLLAADKTQAALDAGAEAFARAPADDLEDIALDHREGTLLLWAIAAQRIALQGERLPAPTRAQAEALRAPHSIAGTIAAGRWSLVQGDEALAERQLRAALQRARDKGMRYHMVLTTEPLCELLLRQKRLAEARSLLEDVRAFDRERFDRNHDFVRLRWLLSAKAKDSESAAALGAKVRELAGERVSGDSPTVPSRRTGRASPPSTQNPTSDDDDPR